MSVGACVIVSMYMHVFMGRERLKVNLGCCPQGVNHLGFRNCVSLDLELPILIKLSSQEAPGTQLAAHLCWDSTPLPLCLAWNFLRVYVLLCVYMCIHHGTHVEVKGHIVKVDSLLPCESQKSGPRLSIKCIYPLSHLDSQFPGGFWEFNSSPTVYTKGALPNKWAVPQALLFLAIPRAF